MMEEATLTVLVGETVLGEVRLLPAGMPSRRLQYLAATLRQELVFTSWRRALVICDALGLQVENRASAEQIAEHEEPSPAPGRCWACGSGLGVEGAATP